MVCDIIFVRGPSLLEYLDNMQALDRKTNAPLMIPIAEKYKVTQCDDDDLIS